MRLRLVLLCTVFINLFQFVYSQETWQIIIDNDTLAEAGQDILEYDNYIFVASNSRCQPNAQACVMLRKYDQNGNLLWRKEYPDIRHSNENLLHLYNGNLIITGRNNQLENPYEHSYYIIDIEGNIIELKRIKLPMKQISTTAP